VHIIGIHAYDFITITFNLTSFLAASIQKLTKIQAAGQDAFSRYQAKNAIIGPKSYHVYFSTLII